MAGALVAAVGIWHAKTRQIDSAFQLTEHLKALHNHLTHPVGSNSTAAIDRDMAHKLAQPPDNVDKTLWLYELCRFLTQKVNPIIIALFSDSPPCSAATCPEMRASEWQYLCAVHDPPKSCCAIDYSCHTLDWAANTLTSPKNFPSRLAMAKDQATHKEQLRNLTNIFRRVYRIFAHAWFQHRDMFWKVEGRTGLYVLFKMVCDSYDLIPDDNYTVPAEAEGVEPMETASMPPLLVLQHEPDGAGPLDLDSTTVIDAGEQSLSTAGTTKRHRRSPSVGSTAVPTVLEENEEEGEEAEEERVKEESSTHAPRQAPTAEASDTPAGDDTELDATTPGEKEEQGEEEEEGSGAGEAVPAASEDAHVRVESEKQTTSDVDVDEPQADGANSEPTGAGDESAAAVSERQAEDDNMVNPDVRASAGQAEKDEQPIGDLDTAVERAHAEGSA